MIPWRYEWRGCIQLESIDQSVSVPVVIGPIEDPIVIVIPNALFFADEAESIL